MKKFISVILAFVLILSLQTSLAAGKINVQQENFHVINSYSNYGYAYAKVANTGNKPIKVNAGILEVFDADGDNITSTDYLRSYAEYLEPDEYTYVYMYVSLEDEQLPQVDDYLLTITGKSDTDYHSKRLTISDLHYEPNVQRGYSTYNYMYATVTNETDEVVWDVDFVAVLLDDDDNILYMDSSSLYSDKGIMPGSSIQFRMTVSSSFMNYFETNGYSPSKVDAIAFVNERN